MIKHYEGELGIFDYNDEEFEIINVNAGGGFPKKTLRYKGKGLSINLPYGCIDTSFMFYKCEFPDGFSLGDFDTSEVINMMFMFADCKFPEGFSLGDKFDTYKVLNMLGMFTRCKFPKSFSLGDRFSITQAINIEDMFGSCIMPDDFDFGISFDIGKAKRYQPVELAKFKDKGRYGAYELKYSIWDDYLDPENCSEQKKKVVNDMCNYFHELIKSYGAGFLQEIQRFINNIDNCIDVYGTEHIAAQILPDVINYMNEGLWYVGENATDEIPTDAQSMNLF